MKKLFISVFILIINCALAQNTNKLLWNDIGFEGGFYKSSKEQWKGTHGSLTTSFGLKKHLLEISYESSYRGVFAFEKKSLKSIIFPFYGSNILYGYELNLYNYLYLKPFVGVGFIHATDISETALSVPLKLRFEYHLSERWKFVLISNYMINRFDNILTLGWGLGYKFKN